jgi:2-keto-3-deoxy-L-rhamnonate aldolase RhmA
MKHARFLAVVCALALVVIAAAHAQQVGGRAGAGPPGARSPYLTPDPSKQMGWATRDYLNNTLEWPASKPLWNTAKQKLLDGKVIHSFSIGTPDTELFCRMAPHYDFVWIEMQHSVMSWADVAKLIAACPHAGATPMIRLMDEFESTLQHATDIGAIGMIEPTVDTVEKAEQVARYSRYPPFGRRSQGGGQAGSIWGINGVNYRREINANMLVTLMIETPTGVANAYEIARVPGVDAVLAANTDLGNFSGFEDTSPEYQALITRIHDAVLKAGKFVGATHIPEGPTARQDAADFRMFQNPPQSNDGYVPPARGGRTGGANSSAAPETAAPASPNGRGRRGGGAALTQP